MFDYVHVFVGKSGFIVWCSVLYIQSPVPPSPSRNNMRLNLAQFKGVCGPCGENLNVDVYN